MPKDDGPERRKLMRLREVIEQASSREKGTLKRMARMVGPDRLKDIGPEKGEKETTHPKVPIDPKELEERAKRSPHYWTRAAESRLHIRTMRLDSFSLSNDTLKALNEAGMITVEDFNMKSESRLLGIYGLTRDVIKETRDQLYWYGIRTVDNPPPKKSE